jgi:hypothetical protein
MGGEQGNFESRDENGVKRKRKSFVVQYCMSIILIPMNISPAAALEGVVIKKNEAKTTTCILKASTGVIEITYIRPKKYLLYSHDPHINRILRSPRS